MRAWTRRSRGVCAFAMLPVALACALGRDATRPSVLLVVIDTLRADAVSAYGEVKGTTPAFDALAREGLRYSHAYAPAPWTLPSHASLLTGESLATHRVGTPSRVRLPEEMVTLAKRLSDAGYATAAFSENMLVSDVFNMLQGFAHRRAVNAYRVGLGESAVGAVRVIHVPEELQAWLDAQSSEVPFFVFVNLFDPHQPYTIRERNPWVPEGTPKELIRTRSEQPNSQLCGALPSAGEISVQRGLYLGDVAAADEKLGKIVEIARRAASGHLITLVTSDHGELLGERQLMGHEYTLASAVLHVPLAVHGLPQVEPAVLDAPVSLIDLTPSILRWVGLDLPPELPGRVLPLRADPAGPDPRVIRAGYSDRYVIAPKPWEGVLDFAYDKQHARRRCSPSEPVFGGMASLIRFPWKLVWFERYPPELYDLSWDPNERSDVSGQYPERVAAMRTEVMPFVRRSGLVDTPREAASEPSPEAREALEALGYAD